MLEVSFTSPVSPGNVKYIYIYIYEGESNENCKSAIKIWTTAQLSIKLTTVILMVWRVANRWQYDAGMQHDGAVVV